MKKSFILEKIKLVQKCFISKLSLFQEIAYIKIPHSKNTLFREFLILEKYFVPKNLFFQKILVLGMLSQIQSVFLSFKIGGSFSEFFPKFKNPDWI